MSEINHRFISEARSHSTKDIRSLLIDWFCFKLYIRFKPSPEYPNNSGGRTFYGHEHSCTYPQCVAGYVKEIVLDRLKGYNELIRKVELDYKGKYSSAKIYGRYPQYKEQAFPDLHRSYFNGKLDKKTVNDPVINIADQYLKIFFKVENGLLVITETDPNSQ